AVRRSGGPAGAVVRQGGEWGPPRGVGAERGSPAAGLPGPRVAPEPDRRLRAGTAGRGGDRALAPGGEGHAAPTGESRPDRPAADARGRRRLPRRSRPGRLRAPGRSPARLAPLRRAHGLGVARRPPPPRPAPLSRRRPAHHVAVG